MDGKAPQSLLTGKAGELQVASQLALRGFNVHFPLVDYGYDLVIDGGVRIQVKTARLVVRSGMYKDQGAYWFKLAKSMKRAKSKTWQSRPRIFSERSDFVVLWGIDQNRFWVVPSERVDGRQLVVVGPDVWHKALDADELTRLNDEGMSQRALANQFGVAGVTIHRRLHGEHVTPKLTISAQVRECEGRWDLIEAAVSARVSPRPAEVIGAVGAS